jgi:calcium/calmodulin-dependent protein kinase I
MADAEVVTEPGKKRLMGGGKNQIQRTEEAAEEDSAEFDNDIDFVVTLGSRKMLLRAASREEKLAWTKAMGSASVVRSYSSRNLDDGSHEEEKKQAQAKMKSLVLEDLDIGEIIGSGSAGTVKLAVHIPTGLRVAVKIIPKRKFFMNKKLEETTNRELEMLDRIAEFEHPHIVQTYGYINDPDNVYIALELCEGGELLEELEHIGNYTEHDAATIVHNCVDTLAYLHLRGIVHRDIKPENLLLGQKGDPDSIKLADFGLANILEGKDSLQTVCGSPAYMAPEVHNMRNYDEKVDMWSMGVMLFLLLSGTLPFLPPRLVEKAEKQDYEFAGKIWAGVSDAAKDLVVRLLVADPKMRYGVQDVLKHPWITGENRQDIDLNETKKAIALFSAKRKFKGMAHAVIASGRMRRALASFAEATADTAAAGMSMAAEGITDAAYTAMDAGGKVGTTVSDTTVAKTAASAARSAAEMEAVKQARKVGTGRKGAAKGSKKSKAHNATDDIVQLAHSPNADQARKEKMRRVREWLDQARLGLYADRFESEGYDDLEALRDLDDSEVEELIEEVEMKKGHARNMRKRIAELQAAIDIDQHGKALIQDRPEDFSSKFIPYDRLPMPVGRDSDLSFQLGVGIGRVRAPDVLKASADMLQSDGSIDEVHEGTRTRLRSPPTQRQSSTTSSSPVTPGSARGTTAI